MYRRQMNVVITRCRKLMMRGKHNDMQYAENQRIRERKRDVNKNRSVQTLRWQERRPQALRRGRSLLPRGWTSRGATWCCRKARCGPQRRRYRRGGPPSSLARPICRPYILRCRPDRATHHASPFDLGEVDDLVI